MKVLYATSNKGKLMEVEGVLKRYGVEVMSPKELGIEMEVPENGATLEAIGAMKVRWYGEKLENLKKKEQKNKRTEEQETLDTRQETNDNPSTSSGQAKQLTNEELETRNSQLETDLAIMADDEGLAIDALAEEPGVKVRRWKDGVTRMSDEEVIELCLQKMQAIPPEARGATFRTVVVLALPRQVSKLPVSGFAAHSTGSVQASQESNNFNFEDAYDLEYFEGRLRGVILNELKDVKIEGFPFAGLFFVPEWGLTLGEALKLPDAERMKLQAHRGIALDQAVERILEWGAFTTQFSDESGDS